MKKLILLLMLFIFSISFAYAGSCTVKDTQNSVAAGTLTNLNVDKECSGTRFTAGSTYVLNHFEMYIDKSGGSGDVATGYLYDDDGDGTRPGTKLATIGSNNSNDNGYVGFYGAGSYEVTSGQSYSLVVCVYSPSGSNLVKGKATGVYSESSDDGATWSNPAGFEAAYNTYNCESDGVSYAASFISPTPANGTFDNFTSIYGNVSNSGNITIYQSQSLPFDNGDIIYQLEQPNFNFTTNASYTSTSPYFFMIGAETTNSSIKSFTYDYSPHFIGLTPASGNKTNVQITIEANNSVNDLDIYFGMDSTPDAGELVVSTSNLAYQYNTSMAVDGVYYFMACAINTNHCTDIRNLTYDTTEPPITLNAANSFDANNVTANPTADNLTLDITITDNVAISAFEFLCYDSGTLVYNYTNTSMDDVSSFNYFNSTNVTALGWSTNAKINCSAQAADAHTAKAIDDYYYETTPTSLTFDTAEGNTIIINSFRSADWDIVKDFDRYSFTFAPYETDAKSKYKFQVYCDNGFTYHDGTEYDGLFNCLNKDNNGNWFGNWLDFEGTDADVDVTDEGNGWYEIEVEFEGDEITFNSIGGLNINRKDYLYTRSNISTDTAITINDYGINPTFPFTSNNLVGYVNVSATNNLTILYQWIWYKNQLRYSPNQNLSIDLLYTGYSVEHIQNCIGCISSRDNNSNSGSVMGTNGSGDGEPYNLIFNYTLLPNDLITTYNVRYGNFIAGLGRAVNINNTGDICIYNNQAAFRLEVDGFRYAFYCYNKTTQTPILLLNDTSYTGNTNFNTFYEQNLSIIRAVEFNNGTIYYNSSQLVNLSTITAAETSINDNWTFSFRAISNGTYSSWLNTTVTVLNLSVDDCTTNPYHILNISFRDWQDKSLITASGGYNFTFSGLIDTALSGNYNAVNGIQFCSNRNDNTSANQYTVTGSITTTKSGYGTVLNEITESNPYTTSYQANKEDVYLLKLLNSTTVKFNWLTTTYESIDGTMIIYVCDGNGTKTKFLSTPIIDGVSNANIELVNVPYSYSVITNGQLYSDITSFSKCHIESLEEVTFYVQLIESESNVIVDLLGIQCNVTETGVDTVKVEWTSSGISGQTVTGCIYADRFTASGWTNIYINCTSAANSLERTIPNDGNTYLVTGRIYTGGYSKGCIEQIVFNRNKNAKDNFGNMGVLFVIILIAALILAFAGESEKMLFAAGAAYIIAWIIGFLAFDWLMISSLMIFIGAIVIIMRIAIK